MASQELNFNIFNILILFGVIQGPIFGLIVFFNRDFRIIANYFLVFTALALSLNNFQYWIIDVRLAEKMNFNIPFESLIIPMYFLFVDQYLQIKTNKKILIAVLLPFILSSFFRLGLKFKVILLSDNIIHSISIIEEYLSLIFTVLLIAIILFKIYKYEKSRKDFDLLEIKAKTKWLKQILIIGAIVCTFWGFVIKDNIARFEDDLSIYYPLWISITILVYWMVYKGIVETRILTQRSDIRNNTIESIPIAKKLSPINDNLFLEIESVIKEDKLFLNPNLSLELIAEKFDISASHLSRTINKNSSNSFTDFINQLRINESKKMLTNPDYKNYTIEAIGYESGFNSKSNFYTAFKKETQKTPSAYRSGK